MDLMSLENNEGCYNCGTIEDYNGADNHKVRYLCGICVMCGLAPRGKDTFEDIEASLRALRPTKRRFNRKPVARRGKTLSTC